MQKRVFSREFKLNLMGQIASGHKRYSQICREYNIAESILSRWIREYRERGEASFLPQQSEKKEQENLEQKRAWDRDYYQRHKEKRQVANYARKYRMYDYLQQIKINSRCKYCGESHPAVLQFHHRNPEEKDFTVSTFIYHQKGGPAKLEMEIAKCDILCANCHLKYHYDNDARRLRIPDALIKQAEKLKDKVDNSQVDDDGCIDTLYNNYFPEGIDPIHLTDAFYSSLEHSKQK